MKYNKLFFVYLLLSIKLVLSNIFKVKKISPKIKSFRIRSLEYDKENYFLEKVFGNSNQLNYYYTTLFLGPKKIPQTYIIDTGSTITTSPCKKCISCGKHLNIPYELEDDSNIINCNSIICNLVCSSTCLNDKCSFTVNYLENSKLSGIFNMQEIYFEKINMSPNITSKSFKIPIGCTTNETKLFITQSSDGIMGLNNSGKSFVSILYRLKIINKNLFSLCFGQNDGYFSIGQIDMTYHKTKIEYIPILDEEEKNYFIKINEIKIGDKIIPNSYKGFIDSGSSITYFPYDIYSSIINEFKSICKKNGKKCGKFNNLFVKQYCVFFDSIDNKEKAINECWPNITFNLDGHNYTLSANDYYIDMSNNQNLACVGFEGQKISSITLGTTFMHGHDIIFDLGNQQIGFAIADCNRENNNIKSNNNANKNKYIKNKNDKNFNTEKKKNEGLNRKILFILFLIPFLLLILFCVIIVFGRCFVRRNFTFHIEEISNSENNQNNQNA